jgi:hypothetical protein
MTRNVPQQLKNEPIMPIYGRVNAPGMPRVCLGELPQPAQYPGA